MFLLRTATSWLLAAVLLVCPYGCLGKELGGGRSLLSRALGCCGHCGTEQGTKPASPSSCTPEADCLCHGAVLQHRALDTPLEQTPPIFGQPVGQVPQLLPGTELPAPGVFPYEDLFRLRPAGRALCAQISVLLC